MTLEELILELQKICNEDERNLKRQVMYLGVIDDKSIYPVYERINKVEVEDKNIILM